MCNVSHDYYLIAPHGPIEARSTDDGEIVHLRPVSEEEAEALMLDSDDPWAFHGVYAMIWDFYMVQADLVETQASMKRRGAREQLHLREVFLGLTCDS